MKKKHSDIEISEEQAEELRKLILKEELKENILKSNYDLVVIVNSIQTFALEYDISMDDAKEYLGIVKVYIIATHHKNTFSQLWLITSRSNFNNCILKYESDGYDFIIRTGDKILYDSVQKIKRDPFDCQNIEPMFDD